MKEIKNVAILGAGAMGAAYASMFFDAGGFSTMLIAREPRYEPLRAEGLTVNGKHYSIPVIHPAEASDPADFILVALKNQHLADAIHDPKNAVGPETTLLSVMNGLDSEEHLATAYGPEKVLYAVAVGIDALREGNSVTYTKPGKIFFGEADNSNPSDRVLRVKDALDRAGIASDIPTDMMRMLWWKFMVNVGVNQASAAMRATYGVFRSSPDAKELMETLMREVFEPARRMGVIFGEEDLVGWHEVLNTLSPEGKTSMLQDIEAGRKTEVEAFAGKVVELGRRYGIPTPANQVLLNIIHVLEQYRA